METFSILDQRHALTLGGRHGLGQIVVEQSTDQLGDARAACSRRYNLGVFLDHRQSVGDRDRTAAGAQKSVIVLGVADANDIERRQL